MQPINSQHLGDPYMKYGKKGNKGNKGKVILKPGGRGESPPTLDCGGNLKILTPGVPGKPGILSAWPGFFQPENSN